MKKTQTHKTHRHEETLWRRVTAGSGMGVNDEEERLLGSTRSVAISACRQKMNYTLVLICTWYKRYKKLTTFMQTMLQEATTS